MVKTHLFFLEKKGQFSRQFQILLILFSSIESWNFEINRPFRISNSIGTRELGGDYLTWKTRRERRFATTLCEYAKALVC